MTEDEGEAIAGAEQPGTLLEALSGEAGELVSVGRFGIDGEKARDKLRLYQLADPRAWVLLVVEAVVLAGATRVEFEFDADDVRIACEGVRLGAAELDNLLGALFVEVDGEQLDAAGRVRIRMRQQLAFAVNAALALEPRFVRFASGPSLAELHRAELGYAQARLDWTQAKLARAQALVERAQAEVDRAQAEVDRLQGKPVAASVAAPRELDESLLEPPSKPVVWGHRLELRPNAPDLYESLPIAEDLRVHVRAQLRPGTVLDFFTARAGNMPEQRKLIDACAWSRVPIFVGGQQISRAPALPRAAVRERVELDGEELGVAGIHWNEADAGVVHMLGAGVLIESLEPEWAMSGFVAIVDSRSLRRDISQTKLLRDGTWEAILAAVRRLHATLVARLLDLREAQDERHRDLWFEWLSRGGAAELDREPELAPVRELELWPTLLGERRSVAALAAGSRPIRYLRVERAPKLDFVGARRFGDAVIARELGEAALEACFGDDAVEISGAFAQARSFALDGTGGRFAELGAAAAARLPGGYVVRVPLRADGEPPLEPGVDGELGLRSVGAGPSWIRVVSYGRVLDVLALDFGVAGLQAVLAGEFEPDAAGDLTRTAALGRSLLAILRASERLLDAVAEHERTRLGHHPLRALHRGWLHMVASPRVFLRGLGFDEALIEKSLAGASGSSPLEPTHLERRAHASIRTFSRARGEPIALADLIASRRAGEPIHWLDESMHSLPVLDRNVLVLAPADVVLLERVFGRENLIPYEQRVEWLRRREEFLAGPKQRPRLAEGVELPVEVDGPGRLRGAFGLAAPGSDGRARIDVFVSGRPLGEVAPALGVSGLVGWVEGEGDELELAEDLRGLADPSPVIELAVAGAVALVERSLESDERNFQELWRALLRQALAGATGLALLRALEQQGDGDALARVGEIVGLLERLPRHVWEGAVELCLLEGVRPSAAAVRERARESSLRPDPGELARARLRARLYESGCVARLRGRIDLDALELDEVESAGELDSEPVEASSQAAAPAPAPALPSEAPEGAWVVAPIDEAGVVGFVWLGPEPPRLRLGRDSHVDAVLDSIDPETIGGPLPSLPLAAALRGPAVALVDGRLPARSRTLLRGEARRLWTRLAERFATDEAWAEPDRTRAAAALVDLLLRFPEADEADEAEHAALLERLASLRLFELLDGSRISAAVALRERPAELEHLGLAARLAGLTPTFAEPPPVDPEPVEPAEPDETHEPSDWLIAALRLELSLVRGTADELLADAALDSLVLRNVSLESARGRRRPMFEQVRGLVVIDTAHPLVADLLESREPTLLSLLASSVYSFLNLIHASIEDHHEQRFASSHAAHVLSRAARGQRSP